MGIMEKRIEEFKKTAKYVVYPPFPTNIMIEPMNVCNLRCRFCPRIGENRKPSMIKFEIVEKVLKESFLHGAYEVGFFLTGESFLHPKLNKMVQLAKEIGFTYIYITTNGVLANAKKMRELVNSGLNSIKFSISSGNSKQYLHTHGKDKFSVVENNLLDALKLRDESKKNGGSFYRVMVSSVYTKDTYNDICSFRERIVGDVDDYFMVEAEERIGKKIVKKKIEEHINCFLPFNRLHVTAEGYLSMCCKDFNNDLVYSDLAKENVIDGWHNAIASNFRQRFLDNNLRKSLCGNCLHAYNDNITPLVQFRS